MQHSNRNTKNHLLKSLQVCKIWWSIMLHQSKQLSSFEQSTRKPFNTIAAHLLPAPVKASQRTTRTKKVMKRSKTRHRRWRKSKFTSCASTNPGCRTQCAGARARALYVDDEDGRESAKINELERNNKRKKKSAQKTAHNINYMKLQSCRLVDIMRSHHTHTHNPMLIRVCAKRDGFDF